MRYGLLVVFMAMLCLAACSSPAQTQDFVTRVNDAQLKAGDALPAPSGDIILTVTGKIGTTNQDASIVMDRDMIEAVGQVEYSVTDPFENAARRYRGPLMSALLALWQVSADATTLSVSALDDYTADVPIADLRQYPVLFALQQDGAYMPTSTRGPAMIVYPYGYFEFNTQVYNDYWVWQIVSIEVK